MTITTVFIDSDGTINENQPFPNINRPEKVILLPHAAEGIKMLNDMKCRVIVVSNQAGINNPENDLDFAMYKKVTKRLAQLLREAAGARIDDTFVCPHMPKENCGCRKPLPGLFKIAKEKYPDIEYEKSFMIGDRDIDLIPAHAIGMKFILVRTGHGRETEQILDQHLTAEHIVDDMLGAAKIIREIIMKTS